MGSLQNQKVEIYDEKQNYSGNLSASGNIIKNKQLSLGADIYCFLRTGNTEYGWEVEEMAYMLLVEERMDIN